ncbi:MAG: hypothetical protein JNL10_14155 [Verrucomicrobiales bacterium]|nr:hypothetical protein [Verrucomicrobiales bacterium]
MYPRLSIRVAAAILALPCLVADAAGTADAPRRPQSDSEIVAKLRPGALPASERESRQWRLDLERNPTNLPLALASARRSVQRARDEADPRQLGAAMAALAPWWSDNEPGPEVRVLRAIIRQSLHEFEPAIRDLEAAVQGSPRHAQAWLTLCSLHTLRGNFASARGAALQLGKLSDPFTTLAVAAQIGSLTGHAAQAQSSLTQLLESEPAGTPPELRRWAETLTAEIADRRGDFDAAGNHFRKAIRLGPRDPYLLATYSDFLLDRGHRGEVADLLQGWDHADGLLLRQVEATGNPALARELGDRLDSAFARGDKLHLREAARFELRIRHRPGRALTLALENWDLQREPADVRILFEAATAARDRKALETVRTWMESTGLEDIHIPHPPTQNHRE